VRIPFGTNRPTRKTPQRSHETDHRLPDIEERIVPSRHSEWRDFVIEDEVVDVIFPQAFEDRFAWEMIQDKSRYYSSVDGTPFYEPNDAVTEFPVRAPDPSLVPTVRIAAARTVPATTTTPTEEQTQAPDEQQPLRDRWMRHIEDLVGAIPARLPPLREINHRIPIVEADLKYRYHRLRCPDALQRLLIEKINRYTAAGWWEPKTTEQASPLLCILKKNGKLRTVMDLRQRNDNTTHDLTPMPDQDRIRNDVARAAVRSKLDMSDAYEQIRIEPEDVHKTSFSTIYGTFRSHVMQQGDCNAPATFQRLMTHIFRDFIGSFVHVYLDDIFIFSNSTEEHERHLALVFDAFRKAQLYLSREKVNLYAKSMECLGHVIDDDGIHADEDKMTRIRDVRHIFREIGCAR
jgi:hypothetical protein